MSGFDTISPRPGQLDVGALEELLGSDLERGATMLAALVGSSDPALAAAARRIAGRLLLDIARRGRGAGGRPRAVHAAGWSDGELALERSLEPLVMARARGQGVDPAELVERRRRTPRHALCLLVDHSGSMEEERLATAALAAAALVVRVPAPERVVVGFARHPRVLASPARHADPASTVGRVLRLKGHGTTDLAAALTFARDQLARIPAQRRTVLLLSDARATTGDDPLAAARAVDDLRVLAPAQDPDGAYELVRGVGGWVEPVAGPADVPRAVSALLGARPPAPSVRR